MLTRKLFKNARLLDPATELDQIGSILIRDGKIEDVGPKVFIDTTQEDIEVEDCAGKCIAPGLVDMRVATGEPGSGHLETLETVSKAAAAGGVTTIVCLPNTEPVIDDMALLEFIERRGAEVGLINVKSYAAATNGTLGEEMSELGLLRQAGAVGFTDGVKAIEHPMVMRRLLSYATVFNSIILQHPEVSDLVSDGVMSEGLTATRLGLSGIPPVAEVIMIERDLRLSRVTTRAGIDVIRKAKHSGLPVTCDTAPHYFALNEDAVIDYRTFAKVSPPLRSEDDRVAVLEGIEDGTIDAIASDHTPRDQDSKRLPFDQAAFGVVGLETLLCVTLEAVHNGSISLLTALRALTFNPSKILDLEAGRPLSGRDADFVLFDLEIAGSIEAENFYSKCKNSPFDGRPVQGRVLKTIRNGKVVFDSNPIEQIK